MDTARRCSTAFQNCEGATLSGMCSADAGSYAGGYAHLGVTQLHVSAFNLHAQ